MEYFMIELKNICKNYETGIAALKNINLTIQDGDTEIYVYGCYPGYGATGDFRKNLLATKNIKVGDTLTVIRTKTTYNSVAQLANGIYFSHVSSN